MRRAAQANGRGVKATHPEKQVVPNSPHHLGHPYRQPPEPNHGSATVPVMITALVIVITIPIALGVPLTVTDTPPCVMQLPATLALSV